MAAPLVTPAEWLDIDDVTLHDAGETAMRLGTGAFGNCFCCGRPINHARGWIQHTTCGKLIPVGIDVPSEGEGSYMGVVSQGFWPVGPECAKKPILRPYVTIPESNLTPKKSSLTPKKGDPVTLAEAMAFARENGAAVIVNEFGHETSLFILEVEGEALGMLVQGYDHKHGAYLIGKAGIAMIADGVLNWTGALLKLQLGLAKGYQPNFQPIPTAGRFTWGDNND